MTMADHDCCIRTHPPGPVSWWQSHRLNKADVRGSCHRRHLVNKMCGRRGVGYPSASVPACLKPSSHSTDRQPPPQCRNTPIVCGLTWSALFVCATVRLSAGDGGRVIPSIHFGTRRTSPRFDARSKPGRRNRTRRHWGGSPSGTV